MDQNQSKNSIKIIKTIYKYDYKNMIIENINLGIQFYCKENNKKKYLRYYYFPKMLLLLVILLSKNMSISFWLFS